MQTKQLDNLIGHPRNPNSGLQKGGRGSRNKRKNHGTHAKRATLYLAFVQCDNDGLWQEVYNVGTTGVFSFEEPCPNRDAQRLEVYHQASDPAAFDSLAADSETEAQRVLDELENERPRLKFRQW